MSWWVPNLSQQGQVYSLGSYGTLDLTLNETRKVLSLSKDLAPTRLGASCQQGRHLVPLHIHISGIIPTRWQVFCVCIWCLVKTGIEGAWEPLAHQSLGEGLWEFTWNCVSYHRWQTVRLGKSKDNKTIRVYLEQKSEWCSVVNWMRFAFVLLI